LVTVRDLEMFKLPAKEEEPVTVTNDVTRVNDEVCAD